MTTASEITTACRCKRCRKLPRGKIRIANASRYAPYCSFHCQEWARLEDASAFVRNMPSLFKGTP